MLTLGTKVRLRGGAEMPQLGLGVWQAERGKETEDAVRAALDFGYRHVDTAKIYGNEADVGRAVRGSGVRREEIFVTTKLWHADHGYDRARRAFDASLRALGLEYVDLYLIHWPEGDRKGSWRALQEIRKEGRARAIGVSNYEVPHLEEMLSAGGLPEINQVELHPFLAQKKIAAFSAKHGIVVEAYSPLARGRKMNDPVVGKIARDCEKTVAQVLVRWSLQKGYVVIPKSTHPERIRENASVFDFALSDEQMRAIDALDQGLRTCWDPTGIP